MDFLLSQITPANVLGALGGAFYVATYAMKTMVPLRIAGIISCVCFLSYGFLSHSYPTALMYLALLPVNCLRLYQMQTLIKKVREASAGDFSMDWLKPYMRRRHCKAGDVLFNQGDRAEHMFYILSGHFTIPALNVEIPTGKIFGELGFVSPENRRTQSVVCSADGEILEIAYDTVRELYLQNPPFAFYLLKIVSQRMLENLHNMEKALAECLMLNKGKPQQPPAPA